jgi:hypothetical protein
VSSGDASTRRKYHSTADRDRGGNSVENWIGDPKTGREKRLDSPVIERKPNILGKKNCNRFSAGLECAAISRLVASFARNKG